MRQYITPKNIALAVLSIGVVILLCLLLFRRKPDPSLPILQEQQKQLEEMKAEQKRTAEADRQRDSVLKAEYERNKVQRERTLTYIIKEKDEKIDRINSPAYNADSIRRAFANN